MNSIDLDYVRCTNTPAGPFMDAIREVCLHMGLQESSRAIKQDTLNMKFDATPTTAQGVIRVKIETNTRETTPWKPRIALPLSVTNPWFTGTADVLTFELEELLGTKLRALHQRRKGRDLFDLWLGLTQMGAEPQAVVGAFNHYLEVSGVTISASEMRQGLLEKVEHRGFAADLQPLVREIPADYELQAAAALVDEQLVQLL